MLVPVCLFGSDVILLMTAIRNRMFACAVQCVHVRLFICVTNNTVPVSSISLFPFFFLFFFFFGMAKFR